MSDLSPFLIFRERQSAHYGSAPVEPASTGDVREGSVDYFRARERAERAAAKRATSNAARRIHQELAVEYAALVRGQRR
ncbi:hypothetical protein [Sphingomonas sp.]|uniref:hypothetical protein n=1 Tax=Sphingomonas sp. TaxID=28214 RepID=UPI0018548957|nr:hypothetical protein [Sphingomonas sp.]MBA3512333.1 hypothetical protein [Sphingomonas sp.]